jgi:hypothetical protein
MFPVQLRYALAALAAGVLVGCSTTETAKSDGAASREYQTGSNVPRKNRSGDKVQTVDPESVQRTLPGVTSPPGRGAAGG